MYIKYKVRLFLFAAAIEENITMSGQEKIDDSFVSELPEIGLLDKVINRYTRHFDTSVYRIFDDNGIVPWEPYRFLYPTGWEAAGSKTAFLFFPKEIWRRTVPTPS